MTPRAIVQFSGGVGSWAAARRAAERYGAENTTLLFADTRMEDADLYRFLNEAADDVGAELVVLSDGRNPWEVFRDARFLGNSRVDPCSRVLKRDLLRAWIDEHCDPDVDVIVIGIDWTEEHRFKRAEPRWLPFTLWAPMCEEPLVDKDELLAELRQRGIAVPRLYGMGFPHNNCGGFCVKAGMAQFKLLLDQMPERYLYHEQQEEALREHLGKDIAVLRDRSIKHRVAYAERNGLDEVPAAVPVTLRAFRERLGVDASDYDAEEWGGCGCAID